MSERHLTVDATAQGCHKSLEIVEVARADHLIEEETLTYDQPDTTYGQMDRVIPCHPQKTMYPAVNIWLAGSWLVQSSSVEG